MTQATLLQARINHLLQSRDSPKTICPSEVARSLSAHELRTLSASEWRDTMPSIRGILFAMRDRGEAEILQKGQVLGEVPLNEIHGPIRARKTDKTPKSD